MNNFLPSSFIVHSSSSAFLLSLRDQRFSYANCCDNPCNSLLPPSPSLLTHFIYAPSILVHANISNAFAALFRPCCNHSFPSLPPPLPPLSLTCSMNRTNSMTITPQSFVFSCLGQVRVCRRGFVPGGQR